MAKVGSIEVTDKLLQTAMSGKAEGSAYTGAADPTINFGNASSFIDEDQSGKRFNFNITNTTDTDQVININDIIGAIAGSLELKEGVITGSAQTGLSCVGSPRKTDLLVNYVKQYPSRIRSIKFKVDNAEQLDEPIYFITETPFKSQVEEQRVPSDYQSQDTNNPNMVEVSDVKDWLLSNKSTIKYCVHAGRQVSISILFGASFDEVQALEEKAQTAAENVAVAYARSAQAQK
jgi:hypothetical protein